METTQINNNTHLLTLRPLKVDFLYKNSKNQYANGKNTCSMELSELEKNFPLIPAMKSIQINRIH